LRISDFGLRIALIGAVAVLANAEAPTYSKDVAPILNKNCAGCHRPGEVAPMSLLSYKDVRPWVKSIREKVASRTMPPWTADRRYGKFVGERGLSAAEISTIEAWIDGGAREGSSKDLPAAPQFPSGWQLGQPDKVFEVAEEYQVPASGVIEYQHYVVPTNFTEDRFVQAAEIRTNHPELVHHVIVFVQPPANYAVKSFGVSMRKDAQPPREKEPEVEIEGKKVHRGRLGLFMAATGPGDRGNLFPTGSGFRIPAGSKLIFQVHYTPNGSPATEHTKVGLFYTKGTPEYEIKTIGVQNGQFEIPAGESNYRVESALTFLEDARIWNLIPHMHLRGKSFEYRLVYPDGHYEILLSVPQYDFNWQNIYTLAEPARAPKGSRLECVAYFDNSPANRYNPDATKVVRWGDQTWEEMMIGFATYSLDSQRVVQKAAAKAAGEE
jgi:hypothetical protein